MPTTLSQHNIKRVDVGRINDEYVSLWGKHENSPRQFAGLYPIQYPPSMILESLLFVGFNPSFRSPKKKKPKSRTGLDKDVTEAKYYEWKGMLDPRRFQKAEAKYMSTLDQRTLVEKDQYFRILNKVSEASGFGTRWEHIDLFGIRVTQQSKVIELLEIRNIGKEEDEASDGTMSLFAEEQVRIAFKALSLLQPATIAVISALASKVVLKYAAQMGAKLSFMEDLGTYQIALGGKTIPVFLSGMLARQRALDVFSRERLIWHIRHVNKMRRGASGGVDSGATSSS